MSVLSAFVQVSKVNFFCVYLDCEFSVCRFLDFQYGFLVRLTSFGKLINTKSEINMLDSVEQYLKIVKQL